MPLWFRFACAVGIGLLTGLEAWAWMRHRTSALGVAAAGTLSLGAALVAILIAASIGYAIVGGITGWDPAGMLDDEVSSASSDGRSCDPNYEDECLNPNAID